MQKRDFHPDIDPDLKRELEKNPDLYKHFLAQYLAEEKLEDMSGENDRPDCFLLEDRPSEDSSVFLQKCECLKRNSAVFVMKGIDDNADSQ